MRVAVIGSREYKDLQQVREYILALPGDTTVVSGGAKGVDQAAAAYAFDACLHVVQHFPEYEKHGKRAPLVRNKLIVDDCDRLVAFWDGKSTGTMHTVGLAKKAGKPVELIQMADKKP